MGRRVSNITHAYLDLDSVAYLGACIAEKKAYRFVNKVSGASTKEFPNADAAKAWLVSLTDFDDDDDDDVVGSWERETIIKKKPVEDAIKVVDHEMKVWMDVVKKLTGNKNIIFKGFLTPSGIKTKDIKGLENRYQCNRYKDTETWTPMDKPEHLKACRNHILNTYDWVKMAPKGIEADAAVIFFAEKKGLKAVIGTKDKDLKQAMNVNFIDMNPIRKERKLETFDTLGELVLDTEFDKKEVKGNGFKLLCFQTVVGDPSDGYYGVFRFGPIKGYELLKDCQTIEECCDALLNYYRFKFPDGHSYTSWDKQEITRTADELLIQHCQLAYHERGAKDLTNPMYRFLNDEPILKSYD